MNRLGKLISPFLKQSGIEEAVRFERIKQEWSDIFNEPLSSHMYPISLKDGELLINIDSPVWLQQVSFYKDDIVRKLSLFEVKGVRFRLGRIASGDNARTAKPAQSSGKSISPEAARDIEDAISGIKDEELRESIRKVMEKSFLKADS